MLLMQDAESDDEKCSQKSYNHVKSPSRTAAENLQRAQQEIRKVQTNRHSRISSPLRQVIKDEKNERKENQHLGRNKSGRIRTPLNLDVAQAFQPSSQHNPNQATWQTFSKKSIGSLGQIGQSDEVSGF